MNNYIIGERMSLVTIYNSMLTIDNSVFKNNGVFDTNSTTFKAFEIN